MTTESKKIGLASDHYFMAGESRQIMPPESTCSINFLKSYSLKGKIINQTYKESFIVTIIPMYTRSSELLSNWQHGKR